MTERHPHGPLDVLLVEDNPGDVRLTQEAFKDSGLTDNLHVVRDGEQALDFLYRRGEHGEAPLPHVVLLDLNLPKVDGLEVLETIKDDPDLMRIPVVILTSSKAEADVHRSYELHSNAYLTKPVDPNEFVDLVRTFGEFWSSTAWLPSRNGYNA
jgi:CheY-like chemotaxis protein